MATWMQRNKLANGFIKIGDLETEKALKEARIAVGEAEWKKGHSQKTELATRAALKRHEVPFETELSGKLVGVSAGETQFSGQTVKKLRVALEKDGETTVLSLDMKEKYTRDLLAQLDTAIQNGNTGKDVTIGGYVQQKTVNGRPFANHHAVLKDADGQKIEAASEHFEKVKQRIEAATAPLQTMPKQVLDKVSEETRIAYYTELADKLSQSFPGQQREAQREQTQSWYSSVKEKSTQEWHTVFISADDEGKLTGNLVLNSGEREKRQTIKLSTFEPGEKPNSGVQLLQATAEMPDGKRLSVALIPNDAGGVNTRLTRQSPGDKNPHAIQTDGMTPLRPRFPEKVNENDKVVSIIKEKLGRDIVENYRQHAQSKGVER
jgi:hypothetical protein